MKKISMAADQTETIEAGYDEFKRYCETRNYSSFTVKHYDNIIHVFSLFYPLTNLIETVNEDLISDFTRYLQK